MKRSSGMIAGGALLAAAIFLGDITEFRGFGLQDEEIQTIIIDTTNGCLQAKNEVYPEDGPVDPVDPVGPHPDPDKCICQGTGKIVQGDGHVSPCPYHGASLDDNASEEEICSCGCGKAGCDCQKRNRGLFNFR